MHQRAAFAVLLLISMVTACSTVESAGGADVILVDEAEAAADVKADTVGLSPAVEGDVLRAIDTACGDVWCEGDFDYRFKRLVCDFGAERCTLVAVVLPVDEDAAYARACRIRGLADVSDLVGQEGGRTTLKPAFFDKVDDCIVKWAGTIP
jgi:hypothetical protein